MRKTPIAEEATKSGADWRLLYVCEQVCEGYGQVSLGCGGQGMGFCLCDADVDGDMDAAEGDAPGEEDQSEGDSEPSPECVTVCADHCGAFSDCECGDCDDGELCEQTVCIPDKACTGDSQCGPRWCDPWSACGGFETFCDQTGTKNRNCYHPVCPDGACAVWLEPEELACDRDTTGQTCEDDDCDGYGACDYADSCDESAQKCRTCTHRVCGGGVCGAGESYQDCTAEGCTRDADGNECDYGIGMGSGRCLDQTCGMNKDTWTDPATGLVWMVWPAPTTMDHDDALAWCATQGSEWRVPNITELRSLVRGCADIQVGGDCEVYDYCPPCGVYQTSLNSSESWSNSCRGCAVNQGPENGCYWPQALSGPCDDSSWYWSKSIDAGYLNEAWELKFNEGWLASGYLTNLQWARCIQKY